jgi:TrmH family RNA methyltransferase
MITKTQVKFITSLHQKKFRWIEKRFIAEGEKVVRDLLKSDWDVVALYGTGDFFNQLPNNIMISKSTDVNLVTDEELKKISALTTPQKVLAVVAMRDQSDITKGGLKLVLDNISDPGNLGTIIRLADWFGIKDVICSEDTVDCYNPKVVQGTMGSVFNVNCVYKNLNEVFDINDAGEKLPVYGMVLDGESIYHVRNFDDAYILIGNESNGINAGLQKYITDKVTIPAVNTRADSLNAAMATGIIIYELRRR